jgi:gamma-glutamyltranspeptidase/glutathione hydrolase
MKFRIVATLVLALAASCAQPLREAAAPRALRIAQTGHPLATRAALEMLDRGGNAIDAIVAAQMVLGLVEPQFSGIGGGSLLLYWDAANRRLVSLDGLAAAPSHATASLRTDVDGKLLPREEVTAGGRPFGVPGTLPVLAMAHRRYGKLPWHVLFEPAIRIAEAGFPMPKFLRQIIALDHVDPRSSPTLALYFGADAMPLPEGTVIRNPEYARTLRRITARGLDGMLGDGGAERIVAAASGGPHPTFVTAEDLRAYEPLERAPICAPFLAYRVCTVAPPSYGGISLLHVLQVLETRAGGHYDFGDAHFVHLFLEAGKLARADRSLWVGDPAFTAVPTTGLIASAYARSRAASIDADAANPHPHAGVPAGAITSLAPSAEEAMGGTGQLTIADAAGDVVAMTSTINLGFGARIMVDGFVLNDALTNFAAAPKAGERAANAMAPRKRPYTSMAPAIVFDASGRPFAAGGSAGGGPIPDYVVQAWIEVLANGATPAEAVARGHFSTFTPGKIVVEKGTAAEALAPSLRALGHDVASGPLLSGEGFIERAGNGWIGAADPRRGGNAAN